MDFSTQALWEQMGLFAKSIMLALAIMSLVSVYVVAERTIAYVKAQKLSRLFAGSLAESLEQGNLEAALDLEAVPGGYLGKVMNAGLVAWTRCKGQTADVTLEMVARALERQSQRELQSLRRGHSVMATVASTAPFIGLLGTVMGIVTSFESMSASGAGGLGTVSAGIAEALVATAFGLLVAIPAVMAFNYMQGWVEARSVDLSEASNELLDVIARRVHGVPSSGPPPRPSLGRAVPPAVPPTVPTPGAAY